ncbi:MAG: hypothetical protein GY938_32985 [Ketobacter sp.]|nr:hypothetical protein [Ketobacter sp.]
MGVSENAVGIARVVVEVEIVCTEQIEGLGVAAVEDIAAFDGIGAFANHGDGAGIWIQAVEVALGFDDDLLAIVFDDHLFSKSDFIADAETALLGRAGVARQGGADVTTREDGALESRVSGAVVRLGARGVADGEGVAEAGSVVHAASFSVAVVYTAGFLENLTEFLRIWAVDGQSAIHLHLLVLRGASVRASVDGHVKDETRARHLVTASFRGARLERLETPRIFSKFLVTAGAARLLVINAEVASIAEIVNVAA